MIEYIGGNESDSNDFIYDSPFLIDIFKFMIGIESLNLNETCAKKWPNKKTAVVVEQRTTYPQNKLKKLKYV